MTEYYMLHAVKNASIKSLYTHYFILNVSPYSVISRHINDGCIPFMWQRHCSGREWDFAAMKYVKMFVMKKV